MLSDSILYGTPFKVIYSVMLALCLVACIIDPNPKAYFLAIKVGLFVAILLSERWHNRNKALTAVAFVLLFLGLASYVLTRLGINPLDQLG